MIYQKNFKVKAQETKSQDIDQKELCEVLDYDISSGIFTWKVNRGGKAIKGSTAGGEDSHGHIQIKFKGRYYLAHRLAWFYVYGVFPNAGLDHINQTKTDNRLCNLRKASKSQNAINSKINVKNKSGYRGVCWHKQIKKWVAQAQVEGKRKCLGVFDKVEDAASAYKQATQVSFGEFFQR